MVRCLNCDMVFEGAFCSSCGQKATTQRINWQSFILELPQTLFNIEKGVGYTFKELTLALVSALPIMINPFIYLLIGVYYFVLFRSKVNPLGTVAASFGGGLLGFLLFFTMPLLFYWYQLIFVL